MLIAYEAVKFELVDEFRLTEDQRKQIRALLEVSFPDTGYGA